MRTEQSPVDGVVDSVLVPAQPSRPNPGRARARVRSRDHFSLLVVRGDGARVVRFNFTRPVAISAFVGLAFAVSVVGALARDWTQLRELTREARTFARQIADQRETIDSFNRRAAELRQEMIDRKSTRLNSSHGYISYAVFCLKKKKESLDNI